MLVTLGASNANATYNSVLRKWTEHGRIFAFETMDAYVIWNATLLSDELLNAQADLAASRKVEYKRPKFEGIGFFVEMYTKKFLSDFSKDPSSIWKGFLVGADGVEVPPTDIQIVTMTIDDKVFYPHVTMWSKAYIVSFPKIDLGQHPKFIIRSILAESTLKWKLK